MVYVWEPLLLKQRNPRESKCQAERKFKKIPSVDCWSFQRLISLCCLIVVNAPPIFPSHWVLRPAWGPWAGQVFQKMIRVTDFPPYSQRGYAASAIVDVWEKNALRTLNTTGHLLSKSGPQTSSTASPGSVSGMRVLGFTPGLLWGF